MGLFTDRKPYTAISSDAESLLKRGPNFDPAKLLNLIELIQESSPKDAGGHEIGRLIRKKIKHGSPPEQMNALSLLETLVDNGVKTGPLVTESGLGEQLSQFAASNVGHPKAPLSKSAKATRQCRSLLQDWSTRKDRHILSLYSSAGLVDKSEQRRERKSFHPDDDLDAEVFGQSLGSHANNGAQHSRSNSRSFSNSRSSRPPRSLRSTGETTRVRSRSPSPINLREASLATTIATAHNIATRLTTTLITSPNGSHEIDVYHRQAKQLRRHIVQLIHDTDEEVQSYIGQLLAANEELIAALQAHDTVIKNHEELESQEDHDNSDLKAFLGKSSRIQPVRPPPSPSRDVSDSPESSPEPEPHFNPKHSSPAGADPFDPFADDNEQLERPKHTPLW